MGWDPWWKLGDVTCVPSHPDVVSGVTRRHALHRVGSDKSAVMCANVKRGASVASVRAFGCLNPCVRARTWTALPPVDEPARLSEVPPRLHGNVIISVG